MKCAVASRPIRLKRSLFAVALASRTLLAIAGSLTRFHIAPEPAKEGLQQFARQAHLDLVLDPRAVERLYTRGLNGDFGLEEGLAQLLGDTGIDAQLDPTRSRLVVSPRASPGLEPAPVTAQAAFPTTEPAARSDTAPGPPHLPESTVIISTGSYISGVGPTGSEVITIPRETILNSGAATLGDLIKRFPQVFQGGPNQMTHGSDSESQSNAGFGEGIDLRGLGARSTLILVDGMRLAPSGSLGAFTDTMNLPVFAIDHIEIVLDGAAAIYGADAVGGVVNFITLAPGAATETLFQGGGVTQGSLRQGRIGHVTSSQWSSGNTSGKSVFVAELNRQTPLNSIDRPYLSSDQRAYGGVNNDSVDSNPGTVEAGGKHYAIPKGSSGTLNQPLQPDTSNLTDAAQAAQAIPGQTAESLLGKIQQKWGERWSASAEVLVTHRRASEEDQGAQSSLTVPTTNPFFKDPSGVGGPVVVDYDFDKDLGPRTIKADVLMTAASLKIDRTIGEHSSLSVMVSQATEREHQHTRGDINDMQVAADLALLDPTRALNLFSAGSHTNPQTLAGLERIPWYHSISAYDTGALKFEGELWSAHAIPVKEAIGIEVRGQRFDTSWSDGLGPATRTRFRRTMEAAFGQLDIPVFGERHTAPGAQRLDILAAVRFEHTDSVHSTTPSVGLHWMPTRALRLSAKYTKSFRMPDPGDLDTSQNGALILPLRDDSAPGGLTTAVLASGGNPTLRQEQGVSKVVGLGLAEDWSNEKSSRIELTFFRDELFNRIQVPVFSSDVLNDPNQQYLVLRNPSTALRTQICSSPQLSGGDRATCEAIDTIVDLRLTNIQSLDVRGLDLDARLAWHPGWADLLWSVNAVYFLNYDATDAPYLPKASLLNQAGSVVDLNLHSTLALAQGSWSSAVTFNYVNHYTNTYVAPPVPVSSWSTFDFRLGHTFGTLSAEGTRAYEVGVAVLNAFNRTPPVVLDPAQVIAYDPSNATLWGRVLTLYLRKRW